MTILIFLNSGSISVKSLFFTLVCLLCFASNSFAKKHIILGTNTHFSSGKFKIISDIKVSGLHIRHVRRVESNWTYCADKSQNMDHLEMSGPINPDTPYIIEKLLDKIRNSPKRCMMPKIGKAFPISVYLHSGGGSMKDGYKLGEILRAKSTQTIIPYNGACHSSCATAFLGGSYRRMYGKSVLMFHAPYQYKSRYDVVCSKDDGSLKRYMQKMLNEKSGEYLYERAMSYCSQTSGWSLNADAAQLFDITKGVGQFWLDTLSPR